MEDISEIICDYITKHWYSEEEGASVFAVNHNIDEKTVRRITSGKSYSMTIKTLEKICEARDLRLSDFFLLIKK